MRHHLLDLLACPKCLGDLKLEDKTAEEKGVLLEGNLRCPTCNLVFPIKFGVPIFAMRSESAEQRYREIDEENRWVYDVNKLQGHLQFAIESSKYVENLISRLDKALRTLGIFQEGRTPRVLDLGAGWGAFQSWQFAKYGFEVMSLELVPEFVFATDYVLKNGGVFFERVMADCTLLPFKSRSFDIVFCKELVHHLKDPDNLFNEISRIATRNAIIIVLEPCRSVFQNKKSFRKGGGPEAQEMHQNYTYFDYYITQMRKIAGHIKTDGQIISVGPSKHPALSLLLRNIERIVRFESFKERSTFLRSLRRLTLTTLMIVVGGEVELIGTAKEVRLPSNSDRTLVPINLHDLGLNERKLNYYRNELIPEVFRIFSDTHEKYVPKHERHPG
jgi:uncharacterized protein YbaR (Trm112 family)/ubiquinone/menaquinone biosynthesis C-methylase UbiE